MILIYSHKNTKRLQYILNLIFKDLLAWDFEFTSNLEEFSKTDGIKLAYHNTPIEGAMFIYSKNLLFETDIRHQEIQFVEFEGQPCPFPTYNDQSLIPFDLFAASFFLISRYEEYLPHKKDQHKRYQAIESLAFQKNFLNKPMINIWVKYLGEKIRKIHPELSHSNSSYQFTPTYDIDIAWSYKNKGITRNTGGFVRDLLHFNLNAIKARFQVISGQTKDPYDTYELQYKWTQEYQLKPIYFILFAQLGPFDKNTSTGNINFQNLIKDLGDQAQIGIHPSYESNEKIKLLKKEIDSLSETVHIDITKSRQHFLKLNLPSTYRNLLNLGITDDYTMGYADQVGFRASICSPFFFYDLDLESETKLKIHPFALMDGTLKDYLNTNPENAKEIISQLISEVRKVNGHFISLWHNESLSNMGKWQDWLEVYEHLLKEAV